MRSLVGIGLLLTGVLVPLPAAAQDVETLRKELEQMRKQFDTMKDGYEKAINQLGERIQQLENRPQPAAAPPPAAPPPAAVAQAAAPAAPCGPDRSDGPGAPPRALLPLRPARARTAPVRHGGDRRLHRQPHPEQCRQGQRGIVPRAREPLLPARDRAIALRPDRSLRPRGGPLRGRRGGSGRDRAPPGRGQPDPDGAALRHPAQDGPDAQPLRPAQPGARARPAVHRRAQRARALPGRRGPRRARCRAHLGGAPALLPRSDGRRVQRRQRDRLRPRQAQCPAGDRPAAHLLRAGRRERDPARRLGGQRRDSPSATATRCWASTPSTSTAPRAGSTRCSPCWAR